MGFQDSVNCGLSDGEPMADEGTDAQDSDDAERYGGCSWNECAVEFGDPVGLMYCWKGALTPCAMPS